MQITIPTLKVLKLFLDQDTEPQYGVEITKQTRVQAGTLYPILIRLERNGWLTSDWEDIDPVSAGRGPRRYYVLTEMGRENTKTEFETLAEQLLEQKLI